MKTLKFTDTRPSRRRVLTADDLDRLGIELKSDLVWEEANHHRVEVSDRNAELLMAKLPGEFEVADASEETEDSEPEVVTTLGEDSGDGESDEDSEEDQEDDPEEEG